LNITQAIYNSTFAQIGVYLAGAAYCGKDKYSTMILTGPATGFAVTGIIYDMSTDLEGFVGYLDLTKSIHIVLRGSSSVLNWLDDLEVRQVPYTTWSECGFEYGNEYGNEYENKCKVHNGFYKATLGLLNQTIDQIKLLQISKPNYKIYINGHSLGNAIADLLSMELLKKHIETNVYGYGKPRVGNKNYAKFINTKNIEHYRHTHDRDIIPHVPPINGLGYYHSCQEIFEDSTGQLKFCSRTDCEDQTCGNQYTLTQTIVSDHYYYLGHHVNCYESTINL
jgi:predicted lipase